jgi:protein-S-isoprenylcysteine O-methyltransferase Ste14
MSSALFMSAYLVLFGFIHSLLADPRPKGLMRGTFGEAANRWFRVAYVILGLIMVMPFVYILYILPGRVLYSVRAPLRWLMIAGQALAVLSAALALRRTGMAYFFGIAQLLGHSESGELVTDGFYCHLRNPLFLFGIIFLWLFPHMTLNLIIFNVLATIYFYVGALHEERSLLEEFGEKYREYRRRVPMFIPRVRCQFRIKMN